MQNMLLGSMIKGTGQKFSPVRECFHLQELGQQIRER